LEHLKVWKECVPKRLLATGVPPFKQLCSNFVVGANKQIFMSGQNAGATMHFHAAAYNALFFGYKKWILLPPQHAELSGMPVAAYMNDTNRRGIRRYTCLQRPGDVILLPRSYGHATINPLGFTVGVGHLYVDSRTEESLVVHHKVDRSGHIVK
jgi:hypothetical protein